MVVLGSDEARAFIELALDQMMANADTLGPKVSDRPELEDSNSVFGLVTHCLGVADWWLDHVVLGNPTTRDRTSEFESAGTLADLEHKVDGFRARLPGLLRDVTQTSEPVSAHLEAVTASSRRWPWTTGAIVLHVVEELFQHAGHVDITTDLLAARHQVVAAVLVRGDRVLLCHRHPERKWYPNVWDLPGGHVERGEPRLDALVRELREELGVEVDVNDAVRVLRHAPNRDLDIEVWAVGAWSGDVVNAAPEEHDTLRWFALDELDGIEVADPGVVLACRRAAEHVNAS